MAQRADTIFALATPPGQSAIAVFRISGPAAQQVGVALSGKELQHRLAMPALLSDDEGHLLDEAVLVYFEGPHSATGEDTIEIQCHGSLAVCDAVAEYLRGKTGLRPAGPGEFTQRAFANGKLDLTSVEGLADLIDAQTETQRQQALSQLKGGLRRQAETWRHDIISLVGRLESVIDFADEELPDTVLTEIINKRQALIDRIAQELNDGRRGEIIRHGLVATLLGPVNAGKSTALNALAKRPAAIVSNEAGTTRDIVEVRLSMAGIALSILDTAGIRETDGAIEQIGIARAQEAAGESDLVILIMDGSQPNWVEEAQRLVKDVTGPVIRVMNKADCAVEDAPEGYLSLSLHQEADIQQLEDAIIAVLKPLNRDGASSLITRQRHRDLITKTVSALEESRQASLEFEPELVAESLRQASHALAQLTGHIDVEDILGDIFSSFCIGK